MKNYFAFFLIFIPFLLFGQQQDTTAARKEKKLKDPRPRRATIMSTVLPGLGQAYNKSYWKIPVIYAAEGVLIYLVADNNRNYQELRTAIRAYTDKDSTNNSIGPALERQYPFLSDTTEMKLDRDNYKRNRDFAIIGCLLVYGLNILDANVDAHLRGFRISDDLSFRVKPYLQIADRRTLTSGIALTFRFH
jgi:hypothetical protein